MLSRSIILLLLFLPLGAATAAPTECPQHFLGGEAPDTKTVPDDRTQAVCYLEYGLFHSADKKTSLWSAEHLTADRIRAAEQLPRRNPFHPDPSIPPQDRSELADYKGSGMDRGHLSPNGDFDNPDAQRESFSLANMMPQDPTNNRGLWAMLESAVRNLTKEDGEVFVVTGPIFDGSNERINDRVAVPKRIFKAIYDPVKKGAGVYIVDNAAETDWQVISLAELYAITGVDAFPKLPDQVRTHAMSLPGPAPHSWKNPCPPPGRND